jgi:hypothetical protein
MSMCVDCRYIAKVRSEYLGRWNRKKVRGIGCCKNYRPLYRAAGSKEGNDERAND